MLVRITPPLVIHIASHPCVTFCLKLCLCAPFRFCVAGISRHTSCRENAPLNTSLSNEPGLQGCNHSNTFRRSSMAPETLPEAVAGVVAVAAAAVEDAASCTAIGSASLRRLAIVFYDLQWLFSDPGNHHAAPPEGCSGPGGGCGSGNETCFGRDIWAVKQLSHSTGTHIGSIVIDKSAYVQLARYSSVVLKPCYG